MKKLSVLLLSVLFVSFSFLSCSSDDDSSGGSGNSDLVGSWEFSKFGYLVDGEEILEDYEHWAPECGLDHIVFNANNSGVAVDYDIMNDECEEWEDAFAWTLNGDVLTIEDDEESADLNVIELTSSTLKVYEEVDFMGDPMTIVLVLEKM